MILDTNGLSAFADGDSRIESALERATRIAIPVIVLGEYLYGIVHSRKRLAYENWLDGVLANCLLLQVDRDTASEYADVRTELRHKGRPIPTNDAWIAALARQHSMPVLSRDEHFDYVPKVKRIGW